MGDVLSNVVGAIDSNRILELVASDGIGMIFPRTAMALKIRGVDDGRETFLRESSGLIGNIFLVGWASHLMVNMLGNRVNWYNPKGIPGKAWIGAENLGTFRTLYEDALNSSSTKSSQEARSKFIKDVLGGMVSGDREFSFDSRLASLKNLEKGPQTQALKQMLVTVYGKAEAGQQLKNYQDLLGQNPKRIKELRTKLINDGWGRLSKESQEELQQYYERKPKSTHSSLKGLNPIDREATDRTLESQATFIKEHGLTATIKEEANKQKKPVEEFLHSRAGEDFLKTHGFDRQQTFLKTRLNLSLADMKLEDDFIKAVDKDALGKGLTSTVNIRKPGGKMGEFLSEGQSRKTMLTDLKHFLEQYVDRATHAAKQEASETLDWGARRELIHSKLFANTQKGWRKLLPQAEDGLVTATLKSKAAYTGIPFVVALVFGGAFALYNNYLTMKKHGGKVFFPGEGAPPEEATKPQNRLPQPGGLLPPAPNLAPSPYRQVNAFSGYPPFQNPNGRVNA